MGTDVARLAERVTALVEQGLDVAEAYAAAKGSGTKATREHAKAMEKHAKAVRRHQQRVQSARTGQSRQWQRKRSATIPFLVVRPSWSSGCPRGQVTVWVDAS